MEFENFPKTSKRRPSLIQNNELKLRPFLYKPCIVGYMSVNASRSYCSDLSQLKFITQIPKGKLSWNLNHNIDQAVKRTTDDNDEKIDLLLKFLLDRKDVINLPSNTFITSRHTLIRVMYSTFNINEPFRIRASLYKNRIYLDEINSDYEIERRQSRSDQEKTYCAWGYKFEQYMSSDHPTASPSIDKPVIENEEFWLYYCSQIGDHKLFYGAQTDGLLATNPIPTPPDNKDVKENVNYLRQHDFIELKTNKEILNPRLEKNFRRYKLLRCWCQCYLANYKGLLVGFRNDNGIVQQLQWFNTQEIAEYCWREWNPAQTIDFLHYFLTFVKNTFNSYNCGNVSNNPLTLDFLVDIDKKIKVVPVEHKADELLPDWYTEATK